MAGEPNPGAELQANLLVAKLQDLPKKWKEVYNGTLCPTTLNGEKKTDNSVINFKIQLMLRSIGANIENLNKVQMPLPLSIFEGNIFFKKNRGKF